MGRSEELEAELEVVKLEEKLSKAKGTKGGPDRKLKQELREARRAYREAVQRTPAEGDAVASPGPISASVKAQGTGG